MAKKIHAKALSKSAVPIFKLGFLQPKYWLHWFGIALLSLYQYLPAKLKYKLATKLGNWQYNKNVKRRTIATENLRLCFPDWTEAQYTKFLKKHFTAMIYIMTDMPKLWWSSERKLKKNIIVEGFEHIKAAKKNDGNVILLTCHSLALDYGVVGLGLKTAIVSMAKTMRNELDDWIVSRGRTRFNVRLTARSDGMRSLVKETKKQQAFYYIPDEIHNSQRTLKTAFFAHKKKTLPVLAKLTKMTDAKVIPCYSYFDFKQFKYIVKCLPAMQFTNIDDEAQSTLEMNQQIEALINLKPEQYMWTMRLFGPYSVDK